MSLAGMTLAELEELLLGLGQPAYRARQVFHAVQARGVAEVGAMTDLPKELRARLEERAPARSSGVADEHVSADGTVKLLLGLRDGEKVECVWIPEGDRRTVCVSTQVGCGVGCVFCASGAQGVVRNLDAGEIVEQVLWLRDRAGERPTHVVVMGMGEPLHNVDALVTALRLIQDPEGLDIGARRVTVSTSGPRQGFDRLLASGVRFKLALSLHAATDGLRRELVPRGGTGSVAELEEMARLWFEATGRDVTFEYVLLADVNDSDQDADALARVAGRHRNVNLIPMNPVPFAPGLRAPPPERTERFAARLRKAGVVVHLRRQRGDDVAAACGQLRLARQGA
jgi:23S rRNA (adenine2503-C2)-methyltransferase